MSRPAVDRALAVLVWVALALGGLATALAGLLGGRVLLRLQDAVSEWATAMLAFLMDVAALGLNALGWTVFAVLGLAAGALLAWNLRTERASTVEAGEGVVVSNGALERALKAEAMREPAVAAARVRVRSRRRRGADVRMRVRLSPRAEEREARAELQAGMERVLSFSGLPLEYVDVRVLAAQEEVSER